MRYLQEMFHFLASYCARRIGGEMCIGIDFASAASNAQMFLSLEKGIVYEGNIITNVINFHPKVQTNYKNYTFP